MGSRRWNFKRVDECDRDEIIDSVGVIDVVLVMNR